jgi:hypothetical protein
VHHFCLTAFNAYPVIDPAAGGAIGGVETRAWMFARLLARQPQTRVSFVVRHTRQPAAPTAEGVDLVPVVDPLFRMRESVSTMVSRSSRFPWIRCRGFSPSLLWQLPIVGADFLRRRLTGGPIDYRKPMEPIASVDADVFLTFGVVNMTSAAVIASAHARGRPAVLFLGSDSDLDERFRPDSDYVSPYGDPAPLCAWIIDQADTILAQTALQQRMLRERFGRESTVISNPIDHEEWDRLAADPLPDSETGGLSRYVLWIGRAEGVHKRPQLMVDLARMCPEVDFLMVLNPREPVLEARVRGTAPPNLRILPQVPFPRMPALFKKAAALISTSSLEGFPNVFLQAALSRVPIASLVVEPRFLDESSAGQAFDGDLKGLARFVRHLWREPPAAKERDRARQFVIERNGADAQVSLLRTALVESIAVRETRSVPRVE